MSLRKSYSSLRKSRPGGVVPQNRLGYPVHKIPIPTENTVIQGRLFVVKPQTPGAKERQEDVKSCFFLATNIQENGLENPPSLALDVETADYNGTVILPHGGGSFQICVSEDEKHVFFKMGNALIDKMVLPERSLHAAFFADNYAGAVFVLSKNFGYVYVSFVQTGEGIYRFLRERGESKLFVGSSSDVEEKHQEELRRYENLQRDPLTVIRPEVSSDDGESSLISDDILKSGLPSLPKQTKPKPANRQTRSVSRLGDGSNFMSGLFSESNALNDPERPFYKEPDSDVDEERTPLVRETPAPFEPPLYYTVDSDKKFVISFNDFRTLYNNDWINDTLIDFFIAYEMHKAESELRSIQKTDVFAFNSFFFTKLISNPELLEVPPYYKNIKRWLAKVDLMSFSSVIIPVNEHLHWYFIIIKNLPNLLQHAKATQPVNTDENQGNESSVTKTLAEIYVIDSLKQNHASLGPPLKEVIKEYCKEKHDVDISTDSIRLRNARVAKQRNFNDCGIHVLYNISKWFESPSTCELIWRTHGRSKSQVFKAFERDAMRRNCINLLLDLHSKQSPIDSSKTSEDAQDAQSEDEIELISYSSSLIANTENKPEATEAPHDDPSPAEDKLQIPPPEEHVRQSAPKKQAETTPDPRPQEMLSDHREEMGEKTEKVANDIASNSSRITEISSLLNESPVTYTEALNENQQLSSDEKTETVPEPDARSDSHTATEQKFTLTPVTRTLDPRVINETQNKSSQTSGRIESRLLIVGHSDIRRSLMGLTMNKSTVGVLNKVFRNHSEHYDNETRSKVAKCVMEHLSSDAGQSHTRLQKLEKSIRLAVIKQPEPMDVPFVIRDSDEAVQNESVVLEDLDDSSGELNKSVGELSISKIEAPESTLMESAQHSTLRDWSRLSDSESSRTRNWSAKKQESEKSTLFKSRASISSLTDPTQQQIRRDWTRSAENGNTRNTGRLAKEKEGLGSPREDITTRQTRSRARRASASGSSDLEIVDDELELISEVSLVLSSASDEEKNTSGKSSLNRRHRKSTALASRSPRTRIREDEKQSQISRNYQRSAEQPRANSPETTISSSTSQSSSRSNRPTRNSSSPKARRGTRETIAFNTHDDLDLRELVDITEEDDNRQLSSRQSHESLVKTAKRRRVESDRRGPSLQH